MLQVQEREGEREGEQESRRDRERETGREGERERGVEGEGEGERNLKSSQRRGAQLPRPMVGALDGFWCFPIRPCLCLCSPHLLGKKPQHCIPNRRFPKFSPVSIFLRIASPLKLLNMSCSCRLLAAILISEEAKARQRLRVQGRTLPILNFSRSSFP